MPGLLETMHSGLLQSDPYESLLGIKLKERPLNPYQLLNLVELDADRGRVRAALERQKASLLAKRNAVDPEVWNSLHDELEAAAAALLDPEQRTIVDAGIKRKMAAGQAAKNGKARLAANGGATLACPGCHHENAASRRFCTQCGRGLWETCPQCGGEVAGSERFCGHCGADVRGRLEEQTRQIEERLESVPPLLAEHRYDAALAALRSVAALTDPKLEQWAAQALDEIEVVNERWKEALERMQAAKVDARKLVEEKSFAWAVTVLEAIPSPLRDAEAAELLEQAQFAGKELEELVAEIREAAKEGRTWELFPKIDRALALKPDHQAIRNLADQLRQKFIANARKRLADRRYADAVQALVQIPLALRTDEVGELLDVASELSALLSDLNQSPYATPAALTLAQKLARHVPDHEEVGRLVKQLGERCASQPCNPRQARPYWTKPRDKSAAGPAIEWLGQVVRAQSAEPVRQTLRDHPGEYFVALGLALQGLGEAEIDINLMPREQGNVLAKLAALPILGRRATSAWGLDLGSYALKAVKVVKEPGGAIKIQEAHYILLTKPLTHPEAEGQRPAILSAALADLAGRVELKGSHVAAGLSGHQVLGRFFDLPPLPAKKVSSAVEYEARHQIPIDLDELCWDWTTLGESDRKAETGPQPIMVVAARRSHLEDRLGVFKSAGIQLDSIQSNCLALHNALRFELAQQQPQASQVAILDVGAAESNIVVSSPHSVWFRSFGLAGHSFTTALLQELRLAYDQAEEVKRHPAKARRYYHFREALAPLLVQFGGEIDRSLASFRRLSPTTIERLFVLGGGANLHGLLRQCVTGGAT